MANGFGQLLQNPLMMTGMRFLEAGGLQPKGTPIGARIGQAGLGAMADYQSLLNQQMQRKTRETAIAQLEDELKEAKRQRKLFGDIAEELQQPGGLTQGDIASRLISTGDPRFVQQGLGVLAPAQGLGFGDLPGTAQNLIMAGLQPGTQEFQQAMLQAVTKPQTQIQNIMGGKLPVGWRWKEGKIGIESEPIPGTKGAQRTTAEAGKLAMLDAAKTNISNVASEVLGNPTIDPTTEKATYPIDRQLILTMEHNVPFSRGRMLRSQYEDAINTKLRLETGAEAPTREIKNIMRRFMPSSLDSDETVVDKMSRFQEYFNTALEIADPELYKRLTKGEDAQMPQRTVEPQQAQDIPPLPPGFEIIE